MMSVIEIIDEIIQLYNLLFNISFYRNPYQKVFDRSLRIRIIFLKIDQFFQITESVNRNNQIMRTVDA